MTPEDLKALTDEDLDQLKMDVDAEVSRRALLDNAEAVVRELNQRVLTARGINSGDEWTQPSGAHDAYSEGWEVTYGGKTWESLISGNVWEPGTSGWREKVEPGNDPPAWIQPTGAHDAYSEGALVTHNGEVWRSIHPGERTNVWEPGVHGWEIVG